MVVACVVGCGITACGDNEVAPIDAASDAKSIDSFIINGAVGTIDGDGIGVRLPFGTDLTALTPTIAFTGVSVEPPSGVAQDFTQTVLYTVTAADQTAQTYEVTASLIESDDKAITSFAIGSNLGVIDRQRITVAVPIGADLTSLAPTIVTTGNTLEPASRVAQDFTSRRLHGDGAGRHVGGVHGVDLAVRRQVPIQTGAGPIAIAVADFDADGRPDLAVVGVTLQGASVSVVLDTTGSGAATPSFGEPSDLGVSDAVAIAAEDFNGDGLPDLAVAGQTSVSILLNTTPSGAAAATFAAPLQLSLPPSDRSLAVGDLDGDGRPDLALANFDASSLSILLNTTPPGALVASFTTNTDFATDEFPRSVAIGDVDGDGRMDLALGTGNAGGTSATVFLNQTPAGAGTPSLAARQPVDCLEGPLFVAMADLNADTRPDLVCSTAARIDTTTPGSSPTFGPTTALALDNPELGPDDTAPAIGDVDGDGTPDVVVGNVIYPNATSDGADAAMFGVAIIVPVFLVDEAGGVRSVGLDGVQLADLDGDGRLDLVGVATFGDSGTNAVVVLVAR